MSLSDVWDVTTALCSLVILAFNHNSNSSKKPVPPPSHQEQRKCDKETGCNEHQKETPPEDKKANDS